MSEESAEVRRSKQIRKVHKRIGEILADKPEFTGSVEFHFCKGVYRNWKEHINGDENDSDEREKTRERARERAGSPRV